MIEVDQFFNNRNVFNIHDLIHTSRVVLFATVYIRFVPDDNIHVFYLNTFYTFLTLAIFWFLGFHSFLLRLTSKSKISITDSLPGLSGFPLESWFHDYSLWSPIETTEDFLVCSVLDASLKYVVNLMLLNFLRWKNP